MLTEAQRIERRRYIGSSDMAAILGLDPFKNAADVYYSKVHELEDRPSADAQAGRQLETAVLDWFANDTGFRLERDVFRVHKNGVLAANHDALVIPEEPVDAVQGAEAKTHALLSNRPSNEWGEAGTDEVPNHVLIQCQHQMVVSDLVEVFVPVLIAGRGFLRFLVPRNADICGIIEDRGAMFHAKHIVEREPPEDVAPSLDVVKAIRRQPNKTISLPPQVLHMAEVFDRASKARKDAEQYEDDVKAEIIAALGDAEAGEFEDGGTLTFMEQTRKAHQVKESTYRVLRIKRKKETAIV